MVIIRQAKPEEAGCLTEIALASKAHWGYDQAFMDACRADLTVTEEQIRKKLYFVAEVEGCIAGFYSLAVDGEEAELSNLFISPASIGKGIGKALWTHMIQTAQRHKLVRVTIHSDPYAEGFYRKMGALRCGEVASTVIPGRLLPLLEIRP
ncbi:GNAT family N-acetyltransferase [Brevibacillus migulae]|uniref:GNAT family N-acetyltransferase n=1 Tax=Brevibacillus migulae TaxID=1644114 RepID=UPI00196B36C6|nr:GNAT family N-acetyltransferase [Brevibacillus migulae]